MKAKFKKMTSRTPEHKLIEALSNMPVVALIRETDTLNTLSA